MIIVFEQAVMLFALTVLLGKTEDRKKPYKETNKDEEDKYNQRPGNPFN